MKEPSQMINEKLASKYDHVDNTAWRDERDPGEQRKHRPPEDRKAGIHAQRLRRRITCEQ